MYACIDAYTCTNTHIHTLGHTHTHTHTHTCTHARMLAYKITCAWTLIDANKQTARGRGEEKEKEKLSFRQTLNLTREQLGAARANTPGGLRDELLMLRRPSDSAARSARMTTGST